MGDVFAAEARDVGLVVRAVGAGPVAPVVRVRGRGGEGDALVGIAVVVVDNAAVVWGRVGKGRRGAVVGYILFLILMVESGIGVVDADLLVLASGVGWIKVGGMSHVVGMCWHVVI